MHWITMAAIGFASLAFLLLLACASVNFMSRDNWNDRGTKDDEGD
jgi:hypothetical protein